MTVFLIAAAAAAIICHLFFVVSECTVKLSTALALMFFEE